MYPIYPMHSHHPDPSHPKHLYTTSGMIPALDSATCKRYLANLDKLLAMLLTDISQTPAHARSYSDGRFRSLHLSTNVHQIGLSCGVR
jgi:hypothetical protein